MGGGCRGSGKIRQNRLNIVSFECSSDCHTDGLCTRCKLNHFPRMGQDDDDVECSARFVTPTTTTPPPLRDSGPVLERTKANIVGKERLIAHIAAIRSGRAHYERLIWGSPRQ